jgi:Flp pilus assembly protein CpaB
MQARGLFVRNWRVLTAIAAVVLAALAGVLVYKYADDAKEDAKAPYEFESVLVADKRIPAGTSFASALDSDLIVRKDRIKADLPSTVIKGEPNDTQLKNAYKTLVASHDIVSGQPIVTEDFVGQGEVQSGISGQLQTDQAKLKDKDGANADQLMAITLTFTESTSVGNFLTPGDTVNIIARLSRDNDKWDTGTDHVKYSSFLLAGIKVLGVGTDTATPQASTSGDGTTPTTQATGNRNNITFEVNARQAEQLVMADFMGDLTLTLNPPSFKAGDFKDVEEIVEQVNLFDKTLPILDRETARLLQKNS